MSIRTAFVLMVAVLVGCGGSSSPPPVAVPKTPPVAPKPAGKNQVPPPIAS